MFLHVGVAKTGTTYLQRILDSNRRLLRSNGVLYPGAAHFKASLALRGAAFRGHDASGAEGAWDRLVQQVDTFDGAALISHETLARTQRHAIEAAVSGFSTTDVRIVVTTRDLARQVPAVWQERLKNRNTESYSDYLDSVFASEQGRRREGSFWQVQDLVGLTGRWVDVVGPERVTIVTVPPPGDPQELWRRFAKAVELPDLPYDLTVDGKNSSLGVVEAELLRRLNSRLPELTWSQYTRLIKRRFAGELAASQTAGRIIVPPRWRSDVESISVQTIAYLEQSGCRVVGDLADLRPDFAEEAAAPAPDDLDDAVVLELSLRVLGGLAVRREPSADKRGPRSARQRDASAPAERAEPPSGLPRVVRAMKRRARLRRG